jgi:hypothetical protein
MQCCNTKFTMKSHGLNTTKVYFLSNVICSTLSMWSPPPYEHSGSPADGNSTSQTCAVWDMWPFSREESIPRLHITHQCIIYSLLHSIAQNQLHNFA